MATKHIHIHVGGKKAKDAANIPAIKAIQQELANIGQRLSRMSSDGSDDAKVLKQAEAFVDKAYDVLRKVM